MRFLLSILFFLLIINLVFASLITVVEVNITSVQAPSLCGHKDDPEKEIFRRYNQASIGSAYIQKGTYSNPIAVSRQSISMRQGGKGYISFINSITPGDLFLAVVIDEDNWGYTGTCAESTGNFYTLSVTCYTESGCFEPCSNTNYCSDHIIVPSNCVWMQRNVLRPAYCMPLSS
jgi:hypothetical protein